MTELIAQELICPECKSELEITSGPEVYEHEDNEVRALAKCEEGHELLLIYTLSHIEDPCF